MFDDVPIESAEKDKQKGGWVTPVISLPARAAVISPSSHQGSESKPGTLDEQPVPVYDNLTVNLRIE